MKKLGLDIETTNYSKRFSPYAIEDKILTIAAFDGKKKYFWNINHPQAPKSDLTSLFKLLADDKIQLIAHNAIFDILWLNVYFSDIKRGYSVDFIPVKCKPFCTMIASDTLNLIDRERGEKNDLETLTLKYISNVEPWKGQIKINKLIEEPYEKVKEYNQSDAVNVYYVGLFEQENLKHKKYKRENIYFAWQMEVFNVLLGMMQRGILVDKEELTRVADEIYWDLTKNENIIFELCEEEFNINSPKQLQNILYNKLGMPVTNVSETTGAPSADNDAIQALLYEIKHDEQWCIDAGRWEPLLKEIQEYRANSKLWSTYIITMPKFLAFDDRIHAKTNIGKGVGRDPNHEYGARTGRLSYSDPNLQQVRKEDRMRGIYIAEVGWTLIDPDYKQLELVVTAFLSQDEKMLEALELGRDMHTANLANVENVEYDFIVEVLANKKHPEYNEWKQKRVTIKPINFGILFGIGDEHLQQVLRDAGVEMSLRETKYQKEKWLRTFPKVKELILSTQKECREQGYILTATGRKIVTPWAKIDPKTGKHEGMWSEVARNYRQGFNGKIQGLAVDLCLTAMLLIDQKLPNYNLIQVHDNLLGHCKDKDVDETVKIVEKAMTIDTKKFMKDYFNVNLNVPLSVDIKTGKRWTA